MPYKQEMDKKYYRQKGSNSFIKVIHEVETQGEIFKGKLRTFEVISISSIFGRRLEVSVQEEMREDSLVEKIPQAFKEISQEEYEKYKTYALELIEKTKEFVNRDK